MWERSETRVWGGFSREAGKDQDREEEWERCVGVAADVALQSKQERPAEAGGEGESIETGDSR